MMREAVMLQYGSSAKLNVCAENKGIKQRVIANQKIQ
jgi:hypothetical protein